jgi:transcriptional repressor NrdR
MHYPHVVKKDGRREPFSKEKLRYGIQMACKKRPVSVAQIESLVNRISRWVQHTPEREMNAQRIGQAVIVELKPLDDVAFVRFASVYKNFRNVQEFIHSLSENEEGMQEQLEPPKKRLGDRLRGPLEENETRKDEKWDKEDNLES